MAGIVLSILAGTPVGSTIVATDIAAFLSAVLLEKQQGEYDYEKIKILIACAGILLVTGCSKMYIQENPQQAIRLIM